MAFTFAKVGSWGLFEKLTSAQQNKLDQDHVNSLDIRSAQTNTLQSITTLAGTGRIISSVANGPDSNTTITAGNGNNAVWIGVSAPITASRTYTMSNSGAVAHESVLFYLDSSVTPGREIIIKDAGANTLFVLGNGGEADGVWCEIFFTGSVWTLWRAAMGARTYAQTFIDSSTPFIVPRGVSFGSAFGYGGGGGGGKGYTDGTFGTNRRASGGGGGGGATAGLVPLFFTPGTVPVVVGAGGAGGAGSGGVSGGDTRLVGMAAFSGAGGGGFGDVATSADNTTILSPGGQPVPVSYTKKIINYGDGWNLTLIDAPIPGQGGASFAALNGYGQAGSKNAGPTTASSVFFGGAGGANGTDGSNYRGGTGGGGGAAGPAGAGADGGAGGNSNPAGTGSAGSVGHDATTGTGAGGGGGGGGGNGSAAAGAGANGGAGGSGLLIVMWTK